MPSATTNEADSAAVSEAEARARWASLDPAVPTGQDAAARRLAILPGDLLAPILRRSRLIGASDALCQAVVVLLTAAGMDVVLPPDDRADRHHRHDRRTARAGRPPAPTANTPRFRCSPCT